MTYKSTLPLLLVILTTSPQAQDIAQDENALPESQTEQVPTSPPMVTTASGLKYRVLQIGSGSSHSVPEPEDTVTVHYSGKLLDGTEFDNTRKRGRPASFPISRVIEGWSEGLQLMTEGSKYQFIVPPDLAYGDKGVSGLVGPQETLVFDVELLKVEKEEIAEN